MSGAYLFTIKNPPTTKINNEQINLHQVSARNHFLEDDTTASYTTVKCQGGTGLLHG